MENQILLSEPFMTDGNFSRSVVLLCEKNEEGSMGLILNKPTEYTVGEVVSELSDFEDIVYIGGPVAQNQLHFIHRYPKRIKGDIAITKDIFWGGELNDLLKKMHNRKIGVEDIRFFLGYSGWTVNQLDDELKENSWITTNCTADFLFSQPPDHLWRELLKKMGGKFREIANYPIDPRMN